MKRLPLRDRFFKYVRTGSGCWQWTAYRNVCGYGMFSVNNQAKMAHRVSYELLVGPIGDGLYVCHKCDNPDHLFLGTQHDNMADAKAKKRHFVCRDDFKKKIRSWRTSYTPDRKNPKPGYPKLSSADIAEIKATPWVWGKTTRELAAKYNVARKTITGIRTGRIQRVKL